MSASGVGGAGPPPHGPLGPITTQVLFQGTVFEVTFTPPRGATVFEYQAQHVDQIKQMALAILQEQELTTPIETIRNTEYVVDVPYTPNAGGVEVDVAQLKIYATNRTAGPRQEIHMGPSDLKTRVRDFAQNVITIAGLAAPASAASSGSSPLAGRVTPGVGSLSLRPLAPPSPRAVSVVHGHHASASSASSSPPTLSSRVSSAWHSFRGAIGSFLTPPPAGGGTAASSAPHARLTGRSSSLGASRVSTVLPNPALAARVEHLHHSLRPSRGAHSASAASRPIVGGAELEASTSSASSTESSVAAGGSATEPGLQNIRREAAETVSFTFLTRETKYYSKNNYNNVEEAIKLHDPGIESNADALKSRIDKTLTNSPELETFQIVPIDRDTLRACPPPILNPNSNCFINSAIISTLTNENLGPKFFEKIELIKQKAPVNTSILGIEPQPDLIELDLVNLDAPCWDVSTKKNIKNIFISLNSVNAASLVDKLLTKFTKNNELNQKESELLRIAFIKLCNTKPSNATGTLQIPNLSGNLSIFPDESGSPTEFIQSLLQGVSELSENQTESIRFQTLSPLDFQQENGKYLIKDQCRQDFQAMLTGLDPSITEVMLENAGAQSRFFATDLLSFDGFECHSLIVRVAQNVSDGHYISISKTADQVGNSHWIVHDDYKDPSIYKISQPDFNKLVSGNFTSYTVTAINYQRSEEIDFV